MMKDDLRSLLGYAWPYRWPLAVASGLMLVQSAAALGVPWLAGHLTTALFGGGGGAVFSVNAIFALQAALIAAYGFLNMGHGYLLARTDEQVVSQLRLSLYEHLQSLPLGYHHERRKGEVLALLTRDVEVVGRFISGTLVTLAPLVLTFLGAFVMMVRIDWVLGGLAGLSVPLFFLVVKLIGRRLRPLSGELAEAHAKAITVAEENLSLLPIVKAFTREAEASTWYRHQIRRLRDLSMQHFVASNRLAPVLQLLSSAGIILLLWLASRKVVAGQLDPAELVSFVMYGLLLTRPMSGLASEYGVVQHTRAAMSRLRTVLQVAPERLTVGAAELPRVRGAVEFQNVCFEYAGRKKVFDALNLKIAPGETVALTGPNGAGKSTLVNLLLRFCDAQSGKILVDGIDISTVSLASLRAQFGLVPQSVLLFSGTVRDNIAYGRANATQQAIEAAARVAGAHDFITKLPDGYDTTIGERGVKLSGGQQQRVALARALLKDPPILILDEATAMFDPAGEEEFLALSADLLKDRTVLLITHHAASLELADRILRAEGGVVSEAHVRTDQARKRRRSAKRSAAEGWPITPPDTRRAPPHPVPPPTPGTDLAAHPVSFGNADASESWEGDLDRVLIQDSH